MKNIIDSMNVKVDICKRCQDEKKVNKFGLCESCAAEVDYEYSPVSYKDENYIKPADLFELINRLRLTESRNKKAYINALVDMGVISVRNDYRNMNQRLGHKILRSGSYYDESESKQGDDDLPF